MRNSLNRFYEVYCILKNICIQLPTGLILYLENLIFLTLFEKFVLRHIIFGVESFSLCL